MIIHSSHKIPFKMHKLSSENIKNNGVLRPCVKNKYKQNIKKNIGAV